MIPSEGEETRRRARELHRAATVVDGHNDLAWRIQGEWGLDADSIDLDRRLPRGHTDLVRLREGGVDVQFWAAYVPVSFIGERAPTIAFEQIELIKRLAARYPDDLEMAYTLADVRRITRDGRIASLIAVEGGHAIDNSLATLRDLHRAGARYLTLTHNATLDWVDAATDEPRSGGLSDFGREVVREMNRLGMLVDLSHVSAEAMHDALDTTRAPVIFSHSSARALADHPRNVPDDVLGRIPENGGVVMVNFYPAFLTPEGAAAVADAPREEERIRRTTQDPNEARAAMVAWLRERITARGTVATIVDHIDHIVRVAGIDHVGLGSDFDGVALLPEGMEDVSRLPALTEELVRRGYSDEEVKKVLGENALRVLGRAEDLARERSSGPLGA